MKFRLKIILTCTFFLFSFSVFTQSLSKNYKSALFNPNNDSSKVHLAFPSETHAISLHLDNFYSELRNYSSFNDIKYTVLNNFINDYELYKNRTYEENILLNESLNGFFIPQIPLTGYQ